MMYYLGLFLISWLVVGFISGIKMIYVDGHLSADNVERIYNNAKNDDERRFIATFSKKKNMMAVCTLFGYVMFFLDTMNTIKEVKKVYRRFMAKIKYKN